MQCLQFSVFCDFLTVICNTWPLFPLSHNIYNAKNIGSLVLKTFTLQPMRCNAALFSHYVSILKQLKKVVSGVKGTQ